MKFKKLSGDGADAGAGALYRADEADWLYFRPGSPGDPDAGTFYRYSTGEWLNPGGEPLD